MPWRAATSLRRAQVCRLTDEGAALHGAMEPAARAAHAVTVEALIPAEQDTLIPLLRSVISGHEHRRGQPDIV